jgi:predicted Zn finger-like uncharacterized protein
MPIITRCPSCDRTLRVPDNLLGAKVRCPSCKTTFTAESAEDEPPSSVPGKKSSPATTDRPSGASRRPPVSAPPPEEPEFEEDFEEEPEEREERPRKRKKKNRFREQARSTVMVPAILLMVVGGLGLATAILELVMVLVGAALPFVANAGGPPGFAGQPPIQGGADKITQSIPVFTGFCWSTTVILGGFSMMRLSNRGAAMTGSIVAMVPCSCCCVLGLPIGIWSIMVLNRPEVADAFG